MQLSEIQNQIVNIRHKNVTVSASAGSGKTSVLVERLARLILDDQISADRILAVTFTNDAAAEMKGRLKRKLLESGNSEWIKNQIALLETASICTIDSFCADLLRRFYYHVPIPLAMAGTLITPAQQNDAVEKSMKQAMASLDEKEMSQLQIYLQAFKKSEEDLRNTVLRFTSLASAKPDPIAWIQKLEQDEQKNTDLFNWFCLYFEERVQAMIEILNEVLDRIYGEDYTKEEKKYDDIIAVTERLNSLHPALKAIRKKDYENFRLLFQDGLASSRTVAKTYNKHSYADLQKDFRGFETEICDVLFPLSLFKKDETRLLSLKQSFFKLARQFMTFYQMEKRSLEVIDYADMEHFAWKLLNISMIAEELRAQYEVIMIDEFQDTNDLQEAIIALFARKDNVFRVGDVKQSIYGFRQAKPSIMKEYMENPDENSLTLAMTSNYRSSSTLIDFSNWFFDKIMNTPMLEKQFKDIDKAQPGSVRQKEMASKPVRFLYTQYQPWAAANDVKLLEARRIHRMNKADLIAQDILRHRKEGMSYRSMCILTRSHAVHEELRDALKAWNIPVLAEIDHGFYTSQAIQIVLAALKVLVNPDDDIAMTAFLCSPLGKVSHAALGQAAGNRPAGMSLYTALRQSELLKVYWDLREMKTDQVPALLKQIYNYEDFYYRHTTGQDKTNLDLLLEMSNTTLKNTTLAQFVALVEKEAKLDKTSEAFPFGKEEDVVKIKTMHHSKGLQYPLVYLYSRNEVRTLDPGNPLILDSDFGAGLKGIDASGHLIRESIQSLALKTKHFHEELDEEMRLLYVAATRAEEELVIVDTIKSWDDYDYPLNTRALLKNRSYTSWLLHTCADDLKNPVRFEETKELIARPEIKQKYPAWKGLRKYSRPVSKIQSRTASKAKEKPVWKPPVLTENRAVKRGSFFHEAAEKLSWPYKREDLLEFAAKNGQPLQEQDINQFLRLNESAQYGIWMNSRHNFELSYSTNEDGVFFHGFMDLVSWVGDEIHILDFKTDTADIETLKKRYRPQLEVYKTSMEAIEPGKTVRTFLYSFYSGQLAEIEI